MSVETVRDALREVLSEAIGVSGAVVATIDGLLIAAELDGRWSTEAEPDSIAALASATVGVGSQFAQMLALGEAGGTVVQGTNGCAAIQRLAGNGILVLYGTDGPNVARLHLAIRHATPRIEAALQAERTPGTT